MKENQSFYEYIQECETFEYSKEYFDLMKEASEIELTARYLESQYFLLEEAEVIASLSLNENYLMESVDTVNLQVLEEKFAEKIAGLKDKAFVILKKCITFFMNFLGRLANIFTNQQGKEIVELRKQVKELQFSNEELKTIAEKNAAQIKQQIASIATRDEYIGKLNNKIEKQTRRIAVEVKQNRSSNNVLQAFIGTFGDDELNKKMAEVTAMASESVNIIAHSCLYSMDDFIFWTKRALEQYIEHMEDTTKNSGAKAKQAAEFAIRRINKTLNNKMEYIISFSELNRLVSKIKSSEERFNKDWDKLNELAKKAKDTDLPNRHNTQNNIDKVRAMAQIQDEQVIPSQNNLVVSGVPGLLIELGKLMQSAIASVMTQLSDLAARRSKAITIEKNISTILLYAKNQSGQQEKKVS